MAIRLIAPMPKYNSATTASFGLPLAHLFKQKLFAWASQFEVACYLDHNGYQGYRHHAYECLVAVGVSEQLVTGEKGAFEALKNFLGEKKDWHFGYLTYDLKNDVEALTSSNHDGLQFPALHFFRPLYVFEIFKEKVAIHSKKQSPEVLFTLINSLGEQAFQPPPPTDFKVSPPLEKGPAPGRGGGRPPAHPAGRYLRDELLPGVFC